MCSDGSRWLLHGHVVADDNSSMWNRLSYCKLYRCPTSRYNCSENASTFFSGSPKTTWPRVQCELTSVLMPVAAGTRYGFYGYHPALRRCLSPSTPNRNIVSESVSLGKINLMCTWPTPSCKFMCSCTKLSFSKTTGRYRRLKNDSLC